VVLTQHKRWGLLKEDVDYLAVAKQVNQIEVYKQAAAAAKVPLFRIRSSKLVDGVVWTAVIPRPMLRLQDPRLTWRCASRSKHECCAHEE